MKNALENQRFQTLPINKKMFEAGSSRRKVLIQFWSLRHVVTSAHSAHKPLPDVFYCVSYNVYFFVLNLLLFSSHSYQFVFSWLLFIHVLDFLNIHYHFFLFLNEFLFCTLFNTSVLSPWSNIFIDCRRSWQFEFGVKLGFQ